MIEFNLISRAAVIGPTASEGYYLRKLEGGLQITIVGPMHSTPRKLMATALLLEKRKGHLAHTGFMQGLPSETKEAQAMRLGRGFISLIVEYD